MDSLSEVLRTIQLDGAVYLNAEFTAPWCVEAQYGLPRRAVQAGADHIIFFHCLTDGRCHGQLVGGGETFELQTGDLVVFAHDHRHLLGSDVSLPATDAGEITPPPRGEEMIQLRHGGGGEAVQFVCGYLSCNRRLSQPLLSALPQVLRVRIGDAPGSAWLLDLLRMGVRESVGGQAGAESILTKLSELLFAEALRRHADALPPGATGWLAGLRDPLVGRALALMHQRPEEPWTVQALARHTASSRSALAERFGKLMGEPPMQYLTRYRLARAAQALRASTEPIAKIAEATGYGSEGAFTRAFKRAYAMPPATWRRQAAAGHASPIDAAQA